MGALATQGALCSERSGCVHIREKCPLQACRIATHPLFWASLPFQLYLCISCLLIYKLLKGQGDSPHACLVLSTSRQNHYRFKSTYYVPGTMPSSSYEMITCSRERRSSLLTIRVQYWTDSPGEPRQSSSGIHY